MTVGAAALLGLAFFLKASAPALIGCAIAGAVVGVIAYCCAARRLQPKPPVLKNAGQFFAGPPLAGYGKRLAHPSPGPWLGR